MTGKSALKQARAAARRRERNKARRSQVKTRIARSEGLIKSGDLQTARESVRIAVSALDRAAEKKVIHPRNAARRKSRLMKKLNRAAATAEKPEAKNT